MPQLPNSQHPLHCDEFFHPKSGSQAKFTELLREKENAPSDKDRIFPLACVAP